MASYFQGHQSVGCDQCRQSVLFFCRQCKFNLCEYCIEYHQRTKSRNGHDIVDYDERNNEDTSKCGFHPQNECVAYCKSCNVPICLLCITLRHKSHDVSELSDKIEELLTVISDENNKLQLSKHDLETVLKHTKIFLSSSYSVYQKTKDQVTARGEEWHEEVDMKVKKTHQELDEMQKKQQTELQKQKTDLEEMIKRVEEMNQKVIEIQRSKNVKEMQTLVQTMETQETFKEFLWFTPPRFYECRLDRIYMQNYFGYIQTLQNESMPFLKQMPQKTESLCKKILPIPKVISVIKTDFSADEFNKYENRFQAITFTDKEKLWVGGSARKLKLFDMQGNLNNTVDITCTGDFLCMYNKQAVFSDWVNKEVKMISDTNNMVTMFSTGNMEPRGITSTASGDFLVCIRHGNCSNVVRFSPTGSVLQKIQYDSQYQPLYEEATYITENVNGDIIVTDKKRKAVIAVDRLGIFQYLYSGKNQSFKPVSIASDSVGHVIIADNVGQIHILDIYGLFLGYIFPKRELPNPCVVCTIGHGELFVGECLTGLTKRIKYFEE